MLLTSIFILCLACYPFHWSPKSLNIKWNKAKSKQWWHYLITFNLHLVSYHIYSDLFTPTNLIWQIHWSPLQARGRRSPPLCCGNILPPVAMWPPCQILAGRDSSVTHTSTDKAHGQLVIVVPIELSVIHDLHSITQVSDMKSMHSHNQWVNPCTEVLSR